MLFALRRPVFGQGAGSEYPMRRVADIFQPLSRPAEMIHVTAVLVLVISARHFCDRHRIAGLIVVKFRRPETMMGPSLRRFTAARTSSWRGR